MGPDLLHLSAAGVSLVLDCRGPGLPSVAVYGLTLDESGKRLYAATHGRGWYVDRIS